jgi:mono/diheme cytochrome c family protein
MVGDALRKGMAMQRRFWGTLTVMGLVTAVGLSVSSGAAGAATAKKAGGKKMVAKKPGANAAALAQGMKLVAASACAGCHKIGDKGGKTGPDLSHVGSRATSAEIAAKIKDPKAKNPKSVMPASSRPDKEIAAMAAYLASLK